MLRYLTLLLAMLLVRTAGLAQGPSADAPALSAEAIMARVAENQDRTESARAQFVYVQHAKVQSRKGDTVMCEEITDTRITPAPKGQTQTLLALSGHVRARHRVVHYTALPKRSDSPHDGADTKDQDDGKEMEVNVGDKETVVDADANNAPVTVSDTDIDLVENMRAHLASDKDSKDGVRAGLFPLTSAQQKEMNFVLKGRETKNGRDTYHIVFRPKDNTEFDWKGDAWIDANAFEPVVVRTALSRGVPLGVRLLLGTNVPGLGFTVIYAPQQGGVWFPSSFGTEFKIRVLFAFHRQIVMSVENRSFERTHVSATVHAEQAKPVVSGSEPEKKP